MKILFISFLLLPFSLYSQIQTSVRTNYLILGLLDDNFGRTFYKSIENRIDHFYPYEKPLVDFIDSSLTKEKRKPKIVTEHKQFHLISPKLVKFINTFYTYKTDSTNIWVSKKGKWELKYYGIFNGIPEKDSIYFKDFIVGNYIRFGQTINDHYTFSFVCSISKASYFFKLITNLGCTEISLKHIDAIPGSTQIQFKPTPELRDYLEKYEYLRKRILEKWKRLYP